MAVDISVIAGLAPIFAFLLVFLVSFASLFKLKEVLTDNKWVMLIISFIIASLFVSLAGTVDVVLNIVPWIAVLLVSLFFVLLLTGFAGLKMDDTKKPIGIAVLVIAALIFLFSAYAVYSEVLMGYIPGPTFGSSGEPEVLFFLDWLYSGRVVGAILLIVVSALVSWVLVKNS